MWELAMKESETVWLIIIALITGAIMGAVFGIMFYQTGQHIPVCTCYYDSIKDMVMQQCE
jgi:hypothetical protein